MANGRIVLISLDFEEFSGGLEKRVQFTGGNRVEDSFICVWCGWMCMVSVRYSKSHNGWIRTTSAGPVSGHTTDGTSDCI